MTPAFAARVDPTAAQIAALPGESPFDGPAYAVAEKQLGATPVLLAVHDDARVVAGCMGFWSPGAALRIPTAPAVADGAAFWAGVMAFCRARRIGELEVQSFASAAPSMPDFPRRLSTRRRFEYVLDLTAPDLEARLSASHRRNVRKGYKAGIGIERSSAPGDSERHLALMQASMSRRRRRGEHAAAPGHATLYAALLAAGAAELFVATDAGTPLSSILVLRSASLAYYHSAGSSPAGMASGSAQLLVVEAAKRLAGEGVTRFNLGGADAGAQGLRRFKQAFGADELALEAGTYAMASWLERKGRALVSRARRRLGA